MAKIYADVRNNSRVLVFKLGGENELPESAPYYENFVAPPAQIGTPEQIAAGRLLYFQYCQACHGAHAIGGGLIRDIRYGAALHDGALWDQVVLEGLLGNQGMAGFKSVLDGDQSSAIRSYVISQAREAAAAVNAPE